MEEGESSMAELVSGCNKDAIRSLLSLSMQ